VHRIRDPARRVPRILVLAVVVLTTCLVSTSCMSVEARTFFDRTNELRAAAGAPPLAEHVWLDLKAQAWAERMASEGWIFHSRLADGLDTIGWECLGENVGYADGTGDQLARLHDAFVNSPTHRHNLVDRRFTHMGVGLARGSDGTVYVSEVFAEIR
jgi:uncharacterized protein YkwD